LLLIADRRLTVPFLRAIHTEVSMAAALDDDLRKITGQICLVFLVLITVHHLILTAIYGKNIKARFGQVGCGVRPKQNQSIIISNVF